MSVSVSTIQSYGDDRRRDSTTGSISAAKKLRAVNSTVQEMHSFANWKFTTRQKAIDVYQGETDYNIPDTLSIADFKDVADVRLEDDHTTRFTYVDPNKFDLLHGAGNMNPMYAVEYRLGDPILRVNMPFGDTSTYLGDTTDYDADGTWTADTSTSDASNITTDTVEYRDGSGSINYDIDVSQSGNNQADISVTLSTAVDLTDYEDFGSAFMWFYIPALDAVTGGTLRWGSDSSNYWSVAVTTNSQNGALVQGWNRLKFNWVGATKTGTPDVAAIDYILWRTSYGAGQSDDTDFRINGLKFFMPTRLDFLYYSNYIMTDSAGTWIAEATATTDILLIPDRYKQVVIDGYSSDLLAQMGKLEESGKYRKRFEKGLAEMSREFGTFQKNETKAFKPSLRWP